MGKYRLGNIIRMTRKSLSITQEDLCDGICSVETLSRMESGKQKPSKETYELLMERMGRIKDRAYSILSVSDLKFLENKILFEDFMHDYEFAQAEGVLENIKKYMGDTVLDRQFVERADSMIEYRMKRISGAEHLERLTQALKLTIPKFGEISLANWPLNNLEALFIMNISSTKAEMKDYEGAISLQKEADVALKQSYIDVEQRALMEVTHLYHYSNWYGIMGDYENSLKYIEEGLKLSYEKELGNVLPQLLFNKGYIIQNQPEEALSKENKEDCIKLFIRSYYIASSMQMSLVTNIITKFIMENYDDYAELFLP